MATYVKWAATALQVFGALKGGKQDASLYGAAADSETRDAYANEEAQRRQYRQFQGTQAAAIAQAGTGYGGTSSNVMDQSAVQAEIDALNTRYRGLTRATLYRAQGKAAKSQGNALAGTALLNGVASYYGGK